MSNAAQALGQHVQTEMNKVIFGMEDAIEQLVIALIAGGHVLIEGVPGLGKTLMAKNFATVIGGRFKRIQCTSDLMPADITGIHVYRSGRDEFELIPGPVFADVLLVDEINRTGPKTQSALLETMEERRVTIDRSSYELPANFLVLASQNPADFEGTYPLPESQLDRFLLQIRLGYPDKAHEIQVLKTYDRPSGGHHADVTLTPLAGDLLEEARQQVSEVHIADNVYAYCVELASASRTHPRVSLGLSTRGVLGLMRCARVRAALNGNDFVAPDDVRAMIEPVLAHRLMLTPDAALEGVEAGDILANLLDQVSIPRE